jgi:uncharacterized glyoxalase superfamily protein PhnB
MSKQSMIILYVADQQRSALFYEAVFEKKPALNVPGMTEFLLNDHFKLGIMPESGIAKIICPVAKNPKEGSGIPRCELYLIVNDPQQALNNAVKAGAVKIGDARAMDWGDTVSYCIDPDGHIIAFAK